MSVRPARTGTEDIAAARAVARFRVLALTLGALGLYATVGDAEDTAFQWLVAFAALPASIGLALGADERRPATIAAVGAAIDLLVLAAAVYAFPTAGETIAAGVVFPVLIAAYTGGPRVGLGAAGAAIAVVSAVVLGRAGVGRGTLPFVLLGIAVSVAIVARADHLRARSLSGEIRSRRRADVVVEQAASPIIVTDATGNVVQVNRAATGLLQPRPYDRTCAAVLALAVGGKAVDCSEGCPLLSAGGEQSRTGIEADHLRVDGSAVPVLVGVAEVAGDAGEPEFVHTLQDITQLRLADEAKTLFLATATHELKTPLVVIRGFLDTIATPEVDDALRATAIDVMRRRAAELSTIIDRLLLAARIEGGGEVVRSRSIDIIPVARERVDALATATGRRILFAEAEAPAAQADASAVATVVDHLLDNACKYSPPDTDIFLLVTHDRDSVYLHLTDHGVGMAPDEAAHCFDRFWQADPTSRRRVGGTGIGLYIVRSLMEAMRGSVEVASELGRGTTFTVRFPRADSDPPERAPEAPAVALTEPPEPSIVREFMRQIGVPKCRADGRA